MKILVTHINPHLDDISAIWLYKKFFPDFKHANVEFLPLKSGTVTFQDKPVDEDPEIIHFGIGKGLFDEHKGDKDDCATSLVWKFIKTSGKHPQNHVELKAYEKLVEWSTLIDLGKAPTSEFGPFSVQAFIRSKDNSPQSSLETYMLGSQILDRIIEVLKNIEQSQQDWEYKVEFDSKFGKSIAISSETIDRAFCKEKGGDLFLMYDPKTRYVQFFTPSFEIDLEPIFKKAKEQDPQADWYLHHSHHMVICGSNSAPDSKRTKLSFEELIELIKSPEG